MSSPFIVPFNFNPVNVVIGTGAQYTVDASKYAKVTINYSLNVVGAAPSAGAGSSSISISNGNISGSIEIWLRPGGTLLLAGNNTPGTASYTPPTGYGTVNTVGIAGLNVIINGVTTSIFTKGTASISGTGGVLNVTCTPTATFSYVAQEYLTVT